MPLELPTLAAFEALPIPERTAWFRAWVKEQPPEQGYNYWDTARCPLAQFGAAIQRLSSDEIPSAGGNTFTVGHGRETCDVRVGPCEMANLLEEFSNRSLFYRHMGSLERPSGFGALACALDNITLS